MNRMVGAAAVAVALVSGPGAALAASLTIDVEPFSSIEISSGIDATIVIGDSQSVVAGATDQAHLDELKVEVSGGRFHAYVDWNLFDIFEFGSSRSIRLTITVPQIEALEANSGADVTAEGIQADSLHLTASSGANLAVRGIQAESLSAESSTGADLGIAGNCAAAHIESSSGADLDAADLVCTDVQVEASSGASVAVHATASVDAGASSGASITIHGNPETIAREESSGGDIRTR